MIPTENIADIVLDVARMRLGTKNILRVMSEPVADAFGNDALWTTIVVRPQAVRKFRGEDLLQTLVDVQSRLRDVGEERFASLHYATEDELAHDVDSES